MQGHYSLNDDTLVQQMTDCTLDPSLFSHEAHLRLAWVQINKDGVDKAIESITGQLKNFVAHVGAQDKYHHTLTIAAVRAVAHFMKKSKSGTFEEFMGEFPELMTQFKELINSHYSMDIFESRKAKEKYVTPDVQPF